MAVVTHDDVNLFSLGLGRISESRLEWGKKLFYLFSYQKISIGTTAFMQGKHIFALIAVQRDFGHFLVACRAQLWTFSSHFISYYLVYVKIIVASSLYLLSLSLFFIVFFQIKYYKISFLKSAEYILLDYKNGVALFKNFLYFLTVESSSYLSFQRK